MQFARLLPPPLAACLVLTLSPAAISTALAASLATKAEVRGILGRAQISRAGKAFETVTLGTSVQPGDVVQTAAGSALDIDLGVGVGLIRLTESTTVVIEKWSSAETTYDLNLFLRDGELLGRVVHPASPSRFQVKVNSGIGAIVEGQFRLSSKGQFVLLDGKAGYVQVPAGGEPVAHTLVTPPAQFFAAPGGVRAAPPELVKEVNAQWRSKLPKH